MVYDAESGMLYVAGINDLFAPPFSASLPMPVRVRPSAAIERRAAGGGGQRCELVPVVVDDDAGAALAAVPPSMKERERKLMKSAPPSPHNARQFPARACARERGAARGDPAYFPSS